MPLFSGIFQQELILLTSVNMAHYSLRRVHLHEEMRGRPPKREVCQKCAPKRVLAQSSSHSHSPFLVRHGYLVAFKCGGKDGPGWEEDESVITMIGDCDAQSVRFYDTRDQMPGHHILDETTLKLAQIE